MRFLLDENFPKSAVVFLRASGHETFDFRGTQDEGMDDTAVFQKAQDLQAVLLTPDRDFFHTIPHLFKSHFGVLVIALRKPNRAAILARFEWMLSSLDAKHYPNRAFQLRDRTYIAYPSIEKPLD